MNKVHRECTHVTENEFLSHTITCTSELRSRHSDIKGIELRVYYNK